MAVTWRFLLFVALSTAPLVTGAAQLKCESLLLSPSIQWHLMRGPDGFACVAVQRDRAELFRVVFSEFPNTSSLHGPEWEPAVIGGITLKWSVVRQAAFPRQAMIHLSTRGGGMKIKMVVAIPQAPESRIRVAKSLIRAIRIPLGLEIGRRNEV